MENSMAMSYATSRETVTGNNEVGLVLAAQKGDVSAFNQLVLSYQDRIYNLTSRLLGDVDLAEDITQDTFLTAYLNLPRFRNGSFRSWLYRIATNACYDEHRRHKRHPVLSIENESIEEDKISPLDEFSSPSPIPEMESERHEMEMVVVNALNQLEVNQRAIVVLVDLQELNYDEAAHVLGIPIGTVKSRLARARLQLQRILGNSRDIY